MGRESRCGLVFLVGPMGAGKSTVGRRLAKRLQRPLVDLDRAIEERTGVDIPTIFDIEGEAGFRRRESALLRDTIDAHERAVIATGGGVVLAAENRRDMQQNGTVVYLRASVDTQYHRVRDSQRPLVQGTDPRGRLAAIFAERDPIYRDVADFTVDTDGNRTEEVVAAIHHYLETQ